MRRRHRAWRHIYRQDQFRAERVYRDLFAAQTLLKDYLFCGSRTGDIRKLIYGDLGFVPVRRDDNAFTRGETVGFYNDRIVLVTEVTALELQQCEARGMSDHV